MNKELHLILLWENARYKQKEILDDIQKKLKICECIEIEWSKKNVASNFTRFYGEKLPNRSFKEKECGSGKFLLVTVWDYNPKYEYIETSRGFEKVNTNIFYLKDRYRTWTGGGHKIHSTNTVPEVNHDITLLLGQNYEDYTKTAPQFWDGSIRSIKRDLTGCDGWKDLKEFFYTLNATINYCVLRNYEILPDEFRTDLHGDIDLLTDNYNDLIFLTNAKPVFKQKYRVHQNVKISGKNVLFDFRYIGDNYYCEEFEENILSNRVLNDKNIYIPNNENAFFSLAYHCLIHKKTIATDYYDKVKTLYKLQDIADIDLLNKYKYPFDFYYQILNDYIKQNNYFYTQPHDKSVFFNKRVVKIKNIIKWLEKNYPLTNVEPYMLGKYYTNSGYQYFIGKLDGKKIFIKWGGLEKSVFNEFKYGKILYKQNPENIIKPYLFNCNNNKNFICTEWIEGIMLSDKIAKEDISERDKESYITQLENISNALISSKTIHRDIRPDNLIITPDGKIKLIDLQFATNYKNFKINKAILRNWEKLWWLGNNYNIKPYYWDDMYSINKIILEFGSKSKNIESNIGKYKINLFYLRWIFHIVKILKFLSKQCYKNISKLFKWINN